VNKREWTELAGKRVLNILRQRRVASKRQLEAKISEGGPPIMRAQPHHITKAITQLEESGQILEIDSVSAGGNRKTTPLYALTTWSTSSQQDMDRLNRVKPAYQDFLAVSQNEEFGKSLEAIVQSAIELSGQYVWFNEPGQSPSAGTSIAGTRLTGDGGPLDHYIMHLSPPALHIGVEDKNYREWIYPYDPHIKQLLGKCQAQDMLPVLVTRKVHYTTRLLFSFLGGLAFQTHYQCFPPKYAERLAEARHKDGLGFADIRFTEEPPQHVIRLFSEYLPRLSRPAWTKFKNNADIIKAYVDEEIDYLHLLAELGIVELEEEEGYNEDYSESEDYEAD